MISEDFLHYIWNFKLFNTVDLKIIKKESLQILKSGQQNTDAGPDFFNAQIKIDSTILAGNVEIHINSSDWEKHHHDIDHAYNNVILHVVYNHDKEIVNANGIQIPTLELKNIVDLKLIHTYERLMLSKNWIPCSNLLKDVDQFVIDNWLERLVFERLERKSIEINLNLTLNKNDWQETFYQFLFKYFGLKVNAEPFFMLAKNTPLKIIDKHKNITTIEALLFGQAGFLTDNFTDEYYLKLQKEYRFLQSKFELKPLDKSLWKFLRLRPSNFPTIRISQLANLLNNESHLFSIILDTDNLSNLKSIFKVETTDYWRNNYTFGSKDSKHSTKKTGQVLFDAIIINVVVPILFVYGKNTNNEEIINKSIKLLQQLTTEHNSIIDNFAKCGLNVKSAMQSQALIELKTNYCSQKKCLHCSIGNQVIKSIKK